MADSVCPATRCDNVCETEPAEKSKGQHKKSRGNKQKGHKKGSNTKADVLYGYEKPARNLVKNWSFQEPLDDSEWRMVNSSGTRIEGAHSGEWCLHVHDRTDVTGGAYQRVHGIKPGTCYYFSCFLKFPTHPEEETFFNGKLILDIKYESTARPKRMKIGKFSFHQGPLEWHQFGGDFKTSDEEGIEWVEIQMRVAPMEVSYYVDSVSVIEIKTEPNWKANMDRIIKKNRTSPVKIRVNLPRYTDPKEFTIQIRQTKRDFAFGASINSTKFNRNEDYRECFFKHFEWAVFTNHTKWKCMEGRKKGNIRFDRVDEAMKRLNERGVTVRGHTIHWNIMEACPDWIHNLNAEELQEEVDRRTKYIVDHFKGQFVQWDVINEHLHQRYLDLRTGNHDQLTRICQIAHEIDPDCHLYINDYEVVRNGHLTSTQANLAKRLLAEGVPVHGIGAQSHLRNPIPIELLKKRVEIIAAVGLPIMMTEFSVHRNDVSERARDLEEALYVYMSNPQVMGVIFWTFWDQAAMGDDMPLFEGDQLEPNEAGEMLISLMNKWKTDDLTLNPECHRTRKRFRAYHGMYELEVLCKGVQVWGQSFKVTRGQFLKLDIDVELGDKAKMEPAAECTDESGDDDDDDESNDDLSNDDDESDDECDIG